MSEAEYRLDELAKTLVDRRHSRKGALKVGAGAFGVALAAMLPGRASAAKGGNSACAHYCNTLFPENVPEGIRGACKSAGAHNQGVCANICAPGGVCANLQQCQAPENCVCFLTVEGVGFCHRSEGCAGIPQCVTTADCPEGKVCAVTCCGPQPVCIRPCTPDVSATSIQVVASGPTTVG